PLLDQLAEPGCECGRPAGSLGCSGGNRCGTDHAPRIVESQFYGSTRFAALAPGSAAGMGTPLRWIAFNLFILAALAVDLGLFHRRPHKITLREAALASFGWIAVSILFGVGVFYFSGYQPALEYFTGYLIEKALS